MNSMMCKNAKFQKFRFLTLDLRTGEIEETVSPQPNVDEEIPIIPFLGKKIMKITHLLQNIIKEALK